MPPPVPGWSARAPTNAAEASALPPPDTYDASSTPHEGISRRHASSRTPKDQSDKVKGVATFGNLTGSAFTAPLAKWLSRDMAGPNIWPQEPSFDGPNDAWYVPGTRNGLRDAHHPSPNSYAAGEPVAPWENSV